MYNEKINLEAGIGLFFKVFLRSWVKKIGKMDLISDGMFFYTFLQLIYGTMYSRVDQVKFVEDSL